MGFNRRANFVPRYLLFLLFFLILVFFFFEALSSTTVVSFRELDVTDFI